MHDSALGALGAALAHHQGNRLEQAEAGYREVLAAEPRHGGALQLLAVLLHQTGRNAEAIELLRQAIAIDPNAATTHANLGVVLEAAGDLGGAAACYARALELRPGDGATQAHLARVLIAEGNRRLHGGEVIEAASCYEKAAATAPDLAIAQSNLGNALRLLLELERAESALLRAVALDPALPEAHNNLGIVYLEQGRLSEAIACYEQALALRPDFAEAHSNLANGLQSKGRIDEAIAHYDRALELAPAYRDAVFNRANALWLRRRLHEAIASFEHAIAMQPEDLLARALLAHPKAMACAWQERDAEEAAVLAAMRRHPGKIPPFNLLAQRSTPAEQLLCAQGWSKRLAGGVQAFPPRRPAHLGERIRLGYLSADFRDHPLGWATASLLEAHDRSAVEVYAYAYGVDDGSAVRGRIVAGSDCFIDLRASADREAAQKIRDDRIDILIDLTGYTLNARSRIMAYRPAPVQVNYLGYFGTMGADFVDAVVVDAFAVPPDQQPFFTEALVPVPCCWPAMIGRAIDARMPSRGECGLPAEAFVFACFNNSYKIAPEMFDVWMRVLAAVPRSVLWLSETNDLVAPNLRSEASSRGVSPERLIFAAHVPTEKYLARLRMADLFLDTLPYNAVTTAYDALWAGLPVLTSAGETFVGRIAGSMLMYAGLPELVTESLLEYERRAVELARDPVQLNAFREQVARLRVTSGLFDAGRAARDLEVAYAGMWESRCSRE